MSERKQKAKLHRLGYPMLVGKTPQEQQQYIAFNYRENLEAIVRDLKNIDSLIPAESSRHGCLFDKATHGEESAIVEARKNDLLRYIQTICQDHIIWSQKLLDAGWTVEQLAAYKRRSEKVKVGA